LKDNEEPGDRDKDGYTYKGYLPNKNTLQGRGRIAISQVDLGKLDKFPNDFDMIGLD